MVYTDKLFLAFLVLLIIVSTVLRDKPWVREWMIIIFSLLVILSWGFSSLVIFMTIALLNYGAVNLFTLSRRREILVIAIIVDLFALGLFKYYDFFSGNVQEVIGAALPAFTLGIPLAISFYTFHLISYLADIHAGKAELVGPRQYFFYLSFFPHVVAGPIVRPWQLLSQIGKVRASAGDRIVGVHHLAVGIFLKAVVANNIAALIDPVWDGSATFIPSASDRFVVAFLYYCQIYADFAGYTLMALGMARLLGYRLPPNFRQPMFAVSLREFWTRWHITLSRWLRDYLYIPLGGNRLSPTRTIANLMITMLLGGLWHGAGWGFVVWGLMHGLGLAVERTLRLPGGRPGLIRPSWWFLTQVWVTIAWIFFRSPDLTSSTAYLAGLIPTGVDSLVIHRDLWIGFVFAGAVIIQQVIQLIVVRQRKYVTEILATTTVLALVCDLLVFSPAKVFIYFKF